MASRIGVIGFLAFTCLITIGNQTAECQNTNHPDNDDIGAYSSIAPPFITPGKDSFATREGDSLVVVVTASCLLEDNSDTQFELLSPTPEFVRVSGGYRSENRADGYVEGLGVIYINPQIGDAGKHVVSLQVRACSGKVERVITFKVRVKQSQPD